MPVLASMSHEQFPGWNHLVSHVSSCTNLNCGCHEYRKLWPKWSHQLTIPSEDGQVETWLWHTIRDGEFKWMCLVCDGDEDHRLKNNRGACRINNLMRHHESPKHQEAVARFLGKEPSPDQSGSAPALALFEDVFRAFQRGAPPWQGYDLPSGRVGKEKACAMIWVLSEAHRHQKMEAILGSDTMTIIRDERAHRLHCRFRAVGDSLEIARGYLGQAHEYSPDALGIVDATRSIYSDFATQFIDPPPGASVEPIFQQDHYNHMCKITEAAAVDSASNEICSVSDMACAEFTPNCRYCLRDAAHSARRVLERLWGKGDSVLSDILGLFCQWRDSVAQLIHHSEGNQLIFKECTESAANEAAVSTRFRNLRAAKHRIETFTTPLSRMVLTPTAILMFCMSMCIEFTDRRRQVANTFLTTINVLIFLIAAMMADGGTEVMYMIRIFDTEDLCLPELCEAANQFLDRITWLYHAGGVFMIDGHTAFIMEWLLTAHFFSTASGEGRCIGGSPVTQAVKQQALRHLQSWTKLARDCLFAEFPEFALVCAFNCFILRKRRSPNAELTQDHHTKLLRLTKTFKAPDLVQQYKEHLSYAEAAYAKSNFTISYWDAWTEALQGSETMQVRHNLARPCGDLKYTLKRGMCFSPVTSGVEQSFTAIEAKLGSRRLVGSSSSEARSIGLLVAHLSESQIALLAAQAQKLWLVVFPKTRTRLQKKKNNK